MSVQKRSREEIAMLIAQDIPEGSYVNLGIGLPTNVAKYLPKDKEIFLHSENGVLAFGPPPKPGQEDEDLVNAGKELVTLLDGGCFMHHGDSFDIMRGGHLDICVIGAFQVAVNGDLANWHTGKPDDVPAVGGAMDLAVGAKSIYVYMEHVTKKGEAKIVDALTYPITGEQCVDRIYTDLCIIELKDQQAYVTEMVAGLSFDELQALTACPLIDATVV
ncbi:3-oxoadipate CoA-transferase subunit B [Acinetobacter gyllenbergii]|uniref:3-oxoadipate CoA-transferase subunit B n=1 Tax=Acinetobacter gyllenbergii CIP 110306 = MTCC 11365 TaxID=1217657 RepID=A0A829HGR0_9GAMM|nr:MULTISPECIES: 3-oxoacid CoA-transferase subunit B [Acinetobacter]ENX57356.1 3-oxoadipate CoA-transferase subunit B [Acinetobacter higginsii]EPF80551.1 3-oxoadipate CoA-transferase subunit B [Acinetobacter gyllenbergii CIP 110306 = MTCC 11365]EPH34143.1 3-oxoadipate CoA-transferase subunit B [Acinetobacter gyllenbergii CIP 110306 = MTCC 11365]MCH7318632.1 3-oxoacid CoA-transferase subunit B [Acinetobacter higginsii]GMA12995.1 3-oxoadipate CoA-transferase subunit B [Acinetobacter gyllenbergii